MGRRTRLWLRFEVPHLRMPGEEAEEQRDAETLRGGVYLDTARNGRVPLYNRESGSCEGGRRASRSSMWEPNDPVGVGSLLPQEPQGKPTAGGREPLFGLQALGRGRLCGMLSAEGTPQPQILEVGPGRVP